MFFIELGTLKFLGLNPGWNPMRERPAAGHSASTKSKHMGVLVLGPVSEHPWFKQVILSCNHPIFLKL